MPAMVGNPSGADSLYSSVASSVAMGWVDRNPDWKLALR